MIFTGACMSVVSFLKKYPEIEIYGKERSYELYKLIKKLEEEKSAIAYLAGLSIPAYSALNLLCKIITDVCRIFDTLIQSIINREYAGGNIQTLFVDVVEYGRSLLGLLTGAFVALCSPSYAAESFLTVPADPSINYLGKKEAARLYAMVDGLHTFFIKHNIDYRICCGTALGAVREGGIIRNDDDIDLMIHPDSVEAFKKLCEDGTFKKETGISISPQAFTGGWQCFYDSSPKGSANSPLEQIGQPFIDIFPGTRRLVGTKSIITYGDEGMYLQSKGDHFTDEDWGKPYEYKFGPTKLYGIAPERMRAYLRRSYSDSALEYVYRVFPHHVWSDIYGHRKTPLKAFSIFAEHPFPRAVRHVNPEPMEFDVEEYNAMRCAL